MGDVASFTPYQERIARTRGRFPHITEPMLSWSPVAKTPPPAAMKRAIACLSSAARKGSLLPVESRALRPALPISHIMSKSMRLTLVLNEKFWMSAVASVAR